MDEVFPFPNKPDAVFNCAASSSSYHHYGAGGWRAVGTSSSKPAGSAVATRWVFATASVLSFVSLLLSFSNTAPANGKISPPCVLSSQQHMIFGTVEPSDSQDPRASLIINITTTTFSKSHRRFVFLKNLYTGGTCFCKQRMQRKQRKQRVARRKSMLTGNRTHDL